MDDSGRQQWLRAVLIGMFYLAVDLTSAAFAAAAASEQMRFIWRLSALVSGLAFAAGGPIQLTAGFER